MIYTIKKLYELEDLHKLVKSGALTEEEYAISVGFDNAVHKFRHLCVSVCKSAKQILHYSRT